MTVSNFNLKNWVNRRTAIKLPSSNTSYLRRNTINCDTNDPHDKGGLQIKFTMIFLRFSNLGGPPPPSPNFGSYVAIFSQNYCVFKASEVC